MKSSKSKPVHEIRIASVKAAIWGNEANGKTMHITTLERIYKDAGTWRSSSSFGRDDLLLLAKVVNAAFDWIVADQNNRQRHEAADTTPHE